MWSECRHLFAPPKASIHKVLLGYVAQQSVVSLIAHNSQNISINVKVSVWFWDVLQNRGQGQKPWLYLVGSDNFIAFVGKKWNTSNNGREHYCANAQWLHGFTAGRPGWPPAREHISKGSSGLVPQTRLEMGPSPDTETNDCSTSGSRNSFLYVWRRVGLQSSQHTVLQMNPI